MWVAGRGDARRRGDDVSGFPGQDRSNHLEMHRGAAMKQPILALVAMATMAAAPVVAQRRQQPPQSPRAGAPKDFTGYWVSVVTEDWRWRMVTPARGDYDSVPLNAAGRRQA